MELLKEELDTLQKDIEALVNEFCSKHATKIPKSYKLVVNLEANYSATKHIYRCEAEINKRQKSWNEMLTCPLTKNDWKKIFKNTFFTQSNSLGNVPGARFYDYLKKLETGSDREVSIDREGNVKRWLVQMKETDRNQINRALEMSGLGQYGLVNYGRNYSNCSVVMGKFW
ncbi:MAG TPA: hypothetical protein VHQ41_03020 [Patescibacteria group bacterium]|nr:hypothetical protein [Patescibacteria group bacterium]